MPDAPAPHVLVLFGARGDLARRKLLPGLLRLTGLEAYERLLHDVLLGDRLLFTRADEIERLWEVVAPVLESPPEPLPYAQGSWGPDAAAALAEPTGWRLPEQK